MVNITRQGDSLVVEGKTSNFYPYNSTTSYPLNSVTCTVDESDMVTFKSNGSNETVFSSLVSDLTIGGEQVTRANAIEKFNALSNQASGGSVDLSDYYTKEETDGLLADKADSQTVTSELANKQDTLVSGTNIKTVEGTSLMGAGNVAITWVGTQDEYDALTAKDAKITYLIVEG